MKYQFWLSNIKEKGHGIGNVKIKHLYDVAETAEEIYEMSEKALAQIDGITDKEIAYIIDSRRTWDSSLDRGSTPLRSIDESEENM